MPIEGFLSCCHTRNSSIDLDYSMEPTKYANMASTLDMQASRAQEESAPLLDLEQQPNVRASEDTNPLTDDPLGDDDASSKESRHDSEHLASGTPRPASAPPHPIYIDHDDNTRGQDLPRPVGYPSHAANAKFEDLTTHLVLLLPRFILSLMWFCLFVTWGCTSIFYLICWVIMQTFTGFTRVDHDKKMVRRDLGGMFNGLMDMFERIW